MLGQWIERLLNQAPSEQINKIEKQELSIEEKLERLSNRMGNYKAKDEEELREIIQDISEILDFVEMVIQKLDAVEMTDRAKKLRQRLKNHQTRARNALAAA